MAQYEYKVIHVNIRTQKDQSVDERVQEALNLHAKDGWRLSKFEIYDLATKVMLIMEREQ